MKTFIKLALTGLGIYSGFKIVNLIKELELNTVKANTITYGTRETLEAIGNDIKEGMEVAFDEATCKPYFVYNSDKPKEGHNKLSNEVDDVSFATADGTDFKLKKNMDAVNEVFTSIETKTLNTAFDISKDRVTMYDALIDSGVPVVLITDLIDTVTMVSAVVNSATGYEDFEQGLYSKISHIEYVMNKIRKLLDMEETIYTNTNIKFEGVLN